MSTALRKFAGESTAHGLLHLTGDRSIYVKAVWLIAALVSLGYCTYKVHGVYQRFVSCEFTNTVRANALDFEFPDVYLCNEKPLSGSYSMSLSREDAELLTRYRKLAKDSLASFEGDSNSWSENYALRLVNSLPYQFLADKLANQASQVMVQYYLNGQSEVQLLPFHHSFYVRCFRLNFSAADLLSLQSPNSYVTAALFLDPPMPLPVDSSNSSVSDRIPYYGTNINLKPYDWDMNYGMDFTQPRGFHVFLTQRGQYPSFMDLSLSVGPALFHQIRIGMQDLVYSTEDFAGQCEGNSEAMADLVDPYSGEKSSFKYNRAVCWYREVARLSQERYNCSLWRLPIPWELRSMRFCFNATEFHGNTNLILSDSLTKAKHAILDAATTACAKGASCRQRTYTYQYSSSSWPSENDWLNYYKGYLTNETESAFTPGISYLLHNSSFQLVRESLLQLSMSSAQFKSQEVLVSLAYDFNSLIADVGGLLGLFLGMSLLSVLELVELLHDCLLSGWKRAKRKPRKSADSAAGDVGRDFKVSVLAGCSSVDTGSRVPS